MEHADDQSAGAGCSVGLAFDYLDFAVDFAARLRRNSRNCFLRFSFCFLWRPKRDLSPLFADMMLSRLTNRWPKTTSLAGVSYLPRHAKLEENFTHDQDLAR